MFYIPDAFICFFVICNLIVAFLSGMSSKIWYFTKNIKITIVGLVFLISFIAFNTFHATISSLFVFCLLFILLLPSWCTSFILRHLSPLDVACFYVIPFFGNTRFEQLCLCYLNTGIELYVFWSIIGVDGVIAF